MERPTGIYILTGKPLLVMTSLSDGFFKKSFILFMLALPPSDKVLRTVKKLEIFKGKSFESHRELSTVFFTSLAILVTLSFSSATAESLLK